MEDRLTKEWKFVGHAARADIALAWLRHACLPDPVFHDAILYSLYYDTPTLDAYGEKRNGDFLKTKVRLRWYDPDVSSDPILRTAFVEVKSKEGAGRRKGRHEFRFERAWLDKAGLDDPAFAGIPGRCGEMQSNFPRGLLPTLVIVYRRRRFVCPATLLRVCLDTAIRVERTNPHVLPAKGPVDIRRMVLEIKGEHPGNPPWCGELMRAGLRLQSFSKYGECVAQLLGEESL